MHTYFLVAFSGWFVIFHVIFAVFSRFDWKWSQRIGQEIDNCVLKFREVVPQFRNPFNSYEASTHHKNCCRLVIQRLYRAVFFQNVPAAAFKKALINMRPSTTRTCLLMHGGKPERLTLFVQGVKVAA